MNNIDYEIVSYKPIDGHYLVRVITRHKDKPTTITTEWTSNEYILDLVLPKHFRR